tara:strand:+ start:14705 stop:16336 length:1632 start_codon:yes stop_codon:yes gene_type:complete
MSKKVFYISDFFVDDVLGGGELNDNELLKILEKSGFEISKMRSHAITQKILSDNQKCFFIVSNFCNLSQGAKRWLIKNGRYIIYEHDHKYIFTRNPADYDEYRAPQSQLRNFSFYKNAQKILVQSSFHKEIMEKNLDLRNIINVSGNLWSLESLELLRELSKLEKKDSCSILQSSIGHKNTADAIKYCEIKGISYDLVSGDKYEDFLRKLGSNKKFIFFPKTTETLSRVVVEARMMGMSVLTNNLVGASFEDWFHMKGEQLIDYLAEKRKEIADIVVGLINQPSSNKSIEISILSTFHQGEKHLEGFLKDITSQTIFDMCELIFVDAASPGKEKQIIEKYIKKFNNIKYIRLEEKLPPTDCINIGIKESAGEYLTFGFIDDRRKNDCLEELYKEISTSVGIDLVYGDVLQTKIDNETFDENTSDGTLFEHSTLQFSKENMVKCLPGPMPLWRADIHEICGLFDEENCNYADDWEMWLRAVNTGSRFKKVNKTVGLYLLGGRSQQNFNPEQRVEEAKIFFRYHHLFGENFNKFKPYFSQFVNRV